MKTKGMQKNTILISSVHKRQLKNEFNTSKTSVQMSLDYVFNSDQARAIRKRAKEMLEQEAKKVVLTKIDKL